MPVKGLLPPERFLGPLETSAAVLRNKEQGRTGAPQTLVLRILWEEKASSPLHLAHDSA